MQNRIKALRQSVRQTQSDFGARIGVKGNTITGYESGIRSPSDAVVKSICREFGVSEVWLRTGEGEMFLPRSPDDELLEILAQIDTKGDDMIRSFILSYWKLPDEEKAVVRKLVDDFYDRYKGSQ